MKKAKWFIVVLVIIIAAFYFLYMNIRTDPLSKKQWYLYNSGNESTISESKEYRDYVEMNAGIDISYKEMYSLYKSKIKTSNEVIVAIIDTGIDYNHEDLNSSIWINEDEIPDDSIDNDKNGYVDDYYGYDFCDNIGNPNSYEEDPDENAHGTMCAGIISAQKNRLGICGIASCANVKIMSLKILNSSGEINTGSLNNLKEAIKYAESNGAQICNLSLSFSTYDKEIEELISNSKMLFIVSAGNQVSRGINIDYDSSYPASYTQNNIITVANLDYNGCLNKSSNYGIKSVDIAAPGTCIFSTMPCNKYSYGTGTSMSSALVTGVASLLLSIDNNLSAEEIKTIICDSANATNELKNKVSSGGYLNSYVAIQKVIEK